MKRKGLYSPGTSFFKWHLIAFIFFTMMVAYSLVAEITYPGNATVPFGVFRPVILERLSLVLIVSMTVVVHFMIQQSRTFLQSRAYRNHMTAMYDLSDEDDAHLRLEIQEDDAEFEDEGFHVEKQKRRQ